MKFLIVAVAFAVVSLGRCGRCIVVHGDDDTEEAQPVVTNAVVHASAQTNVQYLVIHDTMQAATNQNTRVPQE